MTENGAGSGSLRSKLGFVLGPAILLAMVLSPAPAGLSEAAWRTAAAGMLMAVWWISEALPISATALVPLVLFPPLGIASMADTAAPYANTVIFLFLGGFIIAAGMERSGLHRRIAVRILRFVGTKPANLIGGFMAATAFLSMWVSNTATVMMILPMATSVIDTIESGVSGPSVLVREGGTAGGARYRNFSIALLLGIAYAASIGGVGTLIGTPPTALLAGFVAESYEIEIGFAQWMLFGVPVALVGLVIAWLLLTRVLHPVGSTEIENGAAIFEREAQALGAMSRRELTVATIGILTATAWVTQPLLERVWQGITDAGIAMTGALLMFLVPVDWRKGDFTVHWRDVDRIPWAVLILFGGGLSLAGAVQVTGLSEGIGRAMGALSGWPLVALVLAVTTIVIFFTELTSNTATAATFLPIVGSVAVAMGRAPLLLAAPAAMAAGLAFMMPVGTPPNALIFGTGRLTIPIMARAGFLLNIFFVILITLALYIIAIPVFGLDAGLR